MRWSIALQTHIFTNAIWEEVKVLSIKHIELSMKIRTFISVLFVLVILFHISGFGKLANSQKQDQTAYVLSSLISPRVFLAYSRNIHLDSDCPRSKYKRAIKAIRPTEFGWFTISLSVRPVISVTRPLLQTRENYFVPPSSPRSPLFAPNLRKQS